MKNLKSKREELFDYLKKNILPLNEKNDEGHGLSHIEYTIKRSLSFAKQIEEIDPDMVYTIAVYHDIGHHIDPRNHETVSAKMFLADHQLSKFFTADQIKTMAEAIEDHRSSKENHPRSLYGKIIASADKDTSLENFLKRCYAYRIKNNPEMSVCEIIEDSWKHINEKFGPNGYASEKCFFEDLEWQAFLAGAATLIQNKETFKQKFLIVNHIS